MPTIFQRLLDREFNSLPPTVQRLHSRTGLYSYRGEVEVERGTNWVSRVCGWVTRLPPLGTGTIVVDIDAATEGERWTRRVRGHVMRSHLWAAEGLLCEQLGLVTFGFRLDVDDGRLSWKVARVRLFGLPLPTWAFDDVGACESEADGAYMFDVRAALPFVGPLIHYRGWLRVD